MPYCKYCGMESPDEAKCEWCGRERARLAPSTPAPTETVQMAAARVEYIDNETLIDFVAYWIALLFLGGALLAWQLSSPYILVTFATLFMAGILLSRVQVVPAFEEGATDVGVPLMLMLVVLIPALLVFLGYLAYGLITRRADRTVVWLLSPHFVVLLFLVIVTAIAGPDAVPMGMYSEFRGLEFLGLSAVLLGWGAASWRVLLGR